MADIVKTVQGAGNEILGFDDIKGPGTLNIIIAGNRNHIKAPGTIYITQALTIYIQGDNCAVEIGQNTTFVETTFQMDGTGLSITVGEDCMFSAGITLLPSDSHSVFDTITGKWINPPAGIVIGNHVWVGLKAMVLKGCQVGDNSIIAAGSVLTKSVSENCVAAGNPAKIVRENATWNRPLCLHELDTDLTEEQIRQTVDSEAQATTIEVYPTEKDRRIEGWAVQVGEDNALSRIYIMAAYKNGSHHVYGAYKISRPDVAAFYQDNRLVNTGFTCCLPAGYMPDELDSFRVFVCCGNKVTSNSFKLP